MAKKKIPLPQGKVSKTIPKGHIIIYAGPLTDEEGFKEHLDDAREHYDSVDVITEESTYYITGKARDKGP